MFSSKRERSGADLLPDSGEAFAERLDMLATTVSSTAAALAKTDGEIATLRRELGSGLARVEELVAEIRSRARASDVRELEKKLGAISFESSRGSEPKRLDDLSSKIAVLGERVDTLAATVATTASSVVGRDGDVAALRRKIDESGSNAPTVDEALRRRVEDVAAASASSSLRLESHGERLDVLTSRLEALDERLADLVSTIEASERERVTLAASVADAAASRWGELERMLVSLVERLEATEEKVAAVSTDVGRATSLWPAALRSLEARVEALAGGRAQPRADEPRPASDPSLLGALRGLEQRVQRADDAAREERELLLERLDRLSGRLDERLEPVPSGAEIVPFRSDA